MISDIIVLDEKQVDGNGDPAKGADIHHDHIRVHPQHVKFVKEEIEKILGKKMTVMTYDEYSIRTTERNRG